MLRELTVSDFSAVITSGKVLVDFYAPWCGPCKPQAAELEKAEPKFAAAGVVVAKVNIDEQPALAQQYNVMSVPTLITFDEGEVVGMAAGLQGPDKLQSLIESSFAVAV
jgi:thioredoxin 1